MKTMKTLLSAALTLSVFSVTYAEKFKYGENNKRGNDNPPVVAANCTPATAATELDINNTRALIQSGGDMWWDFNRARYEIPKGSNKTSLFAGSLWLAGQDVSGQFKVAALRFRQVGNDYWTGPLSTVDAEIDPSTCKIYDRHWETSRSMVSEFAAWYEAGVYDQENNTNTQELLYPGYSIPAEILEWPAHGRNYDPYNEDYYLAPFFDRDGDGDYDPEGDGDYPGYVLSGKSDCRRRVRDIYGDQNIWWVFNDKGNVHTESGGLSIGMEIRAQAFAFATTDEVNDMTFYNYELINRSTFELADTYFGQWVDPDLGNAQDDYVGCDVKRGLGYVFNGDDNDEDASGNLGYGVNPPALGVDFFQGPFQANDGLDNCLCEGDIAGAKEEDGIVYPGQGAGYGDGIVDNERYGMRKFLYHNNAPGPTGDPNIATDYYNMLRGIWKDGTPMTYGGNGYDPSNPNAIPAGYMFPGDTDPLNWGTDGVNPGFEWSENSANNPVGDRRFVQSSGPFRLGPGAVNNITVGVVWQQATTGGRLASVEEMRKADDKTQALFDSCFEILDGPDAPDVTIQELDREIILMLSNGTNSNNYEEGYSAVDPFLAAPDSVDTNGDGDYDIALTAEEKRIYGTYKFEGYQIYQLADGSVGTSDLDDPDKARLIAQVDVENDIDRLINFEYDSQLDQDIPVLKVDGSNTGIQHAFRVTEDAFATENNKLINHKTYYFMAIAYAYNKYGDGFGNLEYIEGEYDPSAVPAKLGQKLPYLASRKSPAGPVRVYEAIPHITSMEQGGISLNSQFGDGVELTRVEGRGNGSNFLDIKEDVIDSLMAAAPADGEWNVTNLVYKAGFGPVNVKVVDPLLIPSGDFTIAFKDTTANKNYENLTWELYGDNIDTVKAEQTVVQGNEQVIFDLGLSVTTKYGFGPMSGKSSTNGYLGFDVDYADDTDEWLSGIVDQDADRLYNWIKAGTTNLPTPSEGDKDNAEDDHNNLYNTSDPTDATIYLDANENWENIAGRTWAPFVLASYDTAHPLPYFGGFPGMAKTTGQNASEILLAISEFENVPSVDVVITSDKSKWTRCAVLEAGDVITLSQGQAVRGMMRRGLSVDKDGRNQLDPDCNVAEATYNGTQVLGDKADNLSTEDVNYLLGVTGESDVNGLRDYSMGMGWFPGYAINVETGERLNMAFAEDSWLAAENGADMQWNPTSNEVEPLFNELRFGGKHMIYVFRDNTDETFQTAQQSGTVSAEYMMPSYDGGTFIHEQYTDFYPTALTVLTSSNAAFQPYGSVWRAAAWVGYPLLAENAKLFGNSGENDVTVKLRAAQHYDTYASHDIVQDPSSLEVGAEYYVYEGALNTSVTIPAGDSTTTVSTDVAKGSTFKAASSSYTSVSDAVKLVKTLNGGLPLYTFNTKDVAPTLDPAIANEALDIISVVPNPYYAYSQYETGRLDYRVKIINLPEKASIKIFTINGTLVRSYEKDDATTTYIDWDLKNNDRIPIAGGLYLIHVEVPGVGETVIRWFGVLRPIDLNSF